MTPEEAVDAMAERLTAIDYQRHGDKAWSKAALVREYFRRAARWADAYGCDTKTPFFDIAACVDPRVLADQAVVDSVVNGIPRRTPNAMTRLAPSSCIGPRYVKHRASRSARTWKIRSSR